MILILSFQKEMTKFHFLMVHNLPLFPYQVQWSSIQTNWPAWTSAISGQNLEILSFPATVQAVSKYIFFNRLFKCVPCSWIEFLVMANFFLFWIMSRVCRGHQAPRSTPCFGHFLIFNFCLFFLDQTLWRIEFSTNRCSWTKSLNVNFQNFFLDSCWIKPFWSGE